MKMVQGHAMEVNALKRVHKFRKYLHAHIACLFHQEISILTLFPKFMTPGHVDVSRLPSNSISTKGNLPLLKTKTTETLETYEP